MSIVQTWIFTNSIKYWGESRCRGVQTCNFDAAKYHIFILISLTTLNSKIGACLLNIDGTNIEGRKYEIVDMWQDLTGGQSSIWATQNTWKLCWLAKALALSHFLVSFYILMSVQLYNCVLVSRALYVPLPVCSGKPTFLVFTQLKSLWGL